jgi:cell division transport system permease protein
MANKSRKKSRLRSYLSNHLHIALASLGRLYSQPVAALMTATVIAIALALPLGLYIVIDNINKVSGDWGGSTQISLFLHTSANLSDAKQLKKQLSKRNDIKRIEIIGKRQGLKQFRETSGFGDALKYLEENPLPIVLVVHPKTTENQADITTRLVKQLGKNKHVETAQLDVQWVKRLYTLLEIANRSIWVVSSLLAVAVLLIIGNTIRLDIQNRREEIEVSKLIGASDSFIRRPFLYTGLWYGVSGAVMAWIITLISLILIENPVHKLAALYNSNFHISGLTFSNTVILILISCALGLIGSWIAVSRHLKEIEPS